MMKSGPVAASPDAYVGALDGWRRTTVEALRRQVVSAGPAEERIKWGHLVYIDHGPAILIRAEEERVLFGFWRGRALVELESRIKLGGRYEMGTWALGPDDAVDTEKVSDLAHRALELNRALGDPTRSPPVA